MVTKMISQLEKLVRYKDRIIAKQNAIIDEMFILLCERMTSEEMEGLTPLFNMMSEVAKKGEKK